MVGNIMLMLIRFAVIAIEIGIPILLIVFLIKGIKYLNKKNTEKNND